MKNFFSLLFLFTSICCSLCGMPQSSSERELSQYDKQSNELVVAGSPTSVVTTFGFLSLSTKFKGVCHTPPVSPNGISSSPVECCPISPVSPPRSALTERLNGTR